MRRVVFSVFVLAFVSVSFGYIALKQTLAQPLTVAKNELYEVRPGVGFNQLCADWQRRQWLSGCWRYRLLGKLDPSLTHIQAGVYELTSSPVVDTFRKINRGEGYSFSFTIIEGERLSQVLAKLKQAPYIAKSAPDLTKIQQEFGQANLEGWLFPDTYHYYAHENQADIVRRAIKTMYRTLDQLWPDRVAGLPIETRYQALILASIVEKETGLAEERPLIASVFINRLHKKMRLQTDPTVIYGLGDSFDGDIKRRDLRTYTPYNTYKINGLPPTPIAMPSRLSLQAVLQPATSPYYYFVGKGDGSHQFSKTLAEHNLAVKKYQLKNHNDS